MNFNIYIRDPGDEDDRECFNDNHEQSWAEEDFERDMTQRSRDLQ